MYDNARFTMPEFLALDRLYQSLDRRSAISGVRLESVGESATPGGALVWRKRIVFESGHGNRAFMLDKDGTSEPVSEQ